MKKFLPEEAQIHFEPPPNLSFTYADLEALVKRAYFAGMSYASQGSDGSEFWKVRNRLLGQPPKAPKRKK